MSSFGCISICRIVTLKVGGEDTAHGAPPGVGVPTNPRQGESQFISLEITPFDYE